LRTTAPIKPLIEYFLFFRNMIDKSGFIGPKPQMK
jgi:hypothetical protein